jgi:hypothetical protein
VTTCEQCGKPTDGKVEPPDPNDSAAAFDMLMLGVNVWEVTWTKASCGCDYPSMKRADPKRVRFDRETGNYVSESASGSSGG